MAAVRPSPTLRLFWWLHRLLLRVSGGRIGTRVNGMDVLLLTTRGRRSGQLRTIALQYLPDERGYLIIASNAGDERHPAWWLNLAANPDATASIRRSEEAVRARELLDQERAAVLARFVEIDDAYAEYERRTTRRIPVVLLERQ